jgi:3-methyladenine DNA glycosylase AlkD
MVTMVADNVLSELDSLGSEQTRKTYRRHGAGDNVYGVSYANFKVLAKRIKTDHDLAMRLWASGNYDARILATMVADPRAMTEEQIESWAGDLDCYALTGALAGLVAKTPYARSIMEKWAQSDEEWRGSAGWQLLGALAEHDDTLPDDFFERYLETIERDIHTRKNRVRYSMNSALIAIGVRNPALQERAIVAARKVGTVDVDHGDTSCRTPAAEAYILKTAAHRQKKGA